MLFQIMFSPALCGANMLEVSVGFLWEIISFKANIVKPVSLLICTFSFNKFQNKEINSDES